MGQRPTEAWGFKSSLSLSGTLTGVVYVCFLPLVNLNLRRSLPSMMAAALVCMRHIISKINRNHEMLFIGWFRFRA
eukprot:scaffold29772_cov33-Attheya_sp.AAC.3